MHRTLTSLIDKGMVRTSLDAPTVYTAVDLETALESAVKKQESELREMEVRKQELQDLANLQKLRPSDTVATFKIIKSIKELLAVAVPLIESSHDEWLIVCPAYMTVVASLFGVNDVAHEFIKRGGKVRCIVSNISYQVIEPVREMLAIGEEVRHTDQEVIFFVVYDKKYSISGINAEVDRISLNAAVSGLWTDDPTYAKYLSSTFEMLWNQAIDAGGRIQELLEQGPPNA